MTMEGIKVQLEAPECPFKAIRSCKSSKISKKLLILQNIRNLRPPNLMKVMMFFPGMGSKFWVTYMTCFIKIIAIKVCGQKKTIVQSIF